MQDSIDVRDLRINDLIEKYWDDGNGKICNFWFQEIQTLNFLKICKPLELDLDVIEARVKFLIGLLEKCRDQLESEARQEDDKLKQWRDKVDYYKKTNKIKHIKHEVQMEDSESIDSMSKVIQKFYMENLNSYSENKIVNLSLI